MVAFRRFDGTIVIVYVTSSVCQFCRWNAVLPEVRAGRSGRLTSEDATQDRLDIRSYIDTARKHGHRPLDVLRSLFTGNPWQPPVPALA